MATNREFVSQVRSTHRLLSADSKINDRTILNEGRTFALSLIKQSTDKRKLWSSPNLFTIIPCIEFEETPLAECCDYTSPLTIAKSKQRIPKIAEGIYGLLVQSCTSVDGRVRFKESNPSRYSNILKLNLPNKDIYYWIYNDHLWITNPDTKLASIAALFEEDIPTSLLYPNEDCGCKPAKGEDKCKNPLDQPFRCPGFLLGTVSDMVSKKLLQTYFNIPQDKKEDGSDSQTKSND
jgi:hypothetical protein